MQPLLVKFIQTSEIALAGKISMRSAQTPKPAAFMLTSFVLLLIGGGGLVLLVNFTLPTLWPRWLLFFLAICVFTGLALPISVLLNNRFPSDPPARAQVILRQALWLGVYVATLVWLQFGRVLGFALALFVALILIVIEIVLRVRERNQWLP